MDTQTFNSSAYSYDGIEMFINSSDIKRCRVADGTFAFVVQFFLASVVICTLYFKWVCEKNIRPKKIWILDSLKQAFGAALGHTFNLCAAVLFASSNKTSGGNECTWYFIQHTIGTIFGVPVQYLLLRLFEVSIGRNLPKMGEYYNIMTLDVDYGKWVSQCFVWGIIVSIQIGILLIPLYVYNEPLSQFSQMIFQSLDEHPKSELVFVMIIWPAICTSVQFYIVAGFLRRQETKHYSVREDPETLPIATAIQRL